MKVMLTRMLFCMKVTILVTRMFLVMLQPAQVAVPGGQPEGPVQ